MNTLPVNWLTEGLIDFEYKKYLLLAYLKAVKAEFGEQRLYPVFSDLIMHYRNLQQVKEHKQLVYEQFPERISRSDFEKLELVYEKIVEDDETMQQIEEIIQFASPLFNHALKEGKELYDFVERHLEINPVGITPIYHNEGYIFLEAYPGKETQVYLYHITVFENTYEKYKGINTRHLQTIRRGLAQTHESLKVRLLRERQELPNPATFAVVSRVPVPLEHALLPIAKRSLVKYVTRLAS
ncbi:hypothetical protein CLV24_11846 [Pontibacter ummariensis]|uniref:Uncharacterized protein n=1 Tax=Pontibacter ummariensis TaxID=1610492 RepID=A0A239ISV9_9BACT|nr:hypothetical protein [Pontibacter ummariensis]PRY09707.1 hypothetical protein CLV24_11846 [Pontibacter ummariensis]SNS95504.1 hypothetical protein SAMN06296052_11842 [Pontibacter ummariensis]